MSPPVRATALLKPDAALEAWGLIRNSTNPDDFDDIAKAEFYFGESWGNEIFPVLNTGSVIGVRTHAWGTFLACCRLTFTDVTRETVILYRYLDFHMLQDNPETE